MRTVVLTLLTTICCAVPAAHAFENTLLAPGTRAPTFSLPGIDNKRISLSDYCGDTLTKPYLNKIHHIVIVSFWATYCAPCQKEIPQLEQFMKSHTGDSIKLFCISIDGEGSAVVEPFVQEKKYEVPVLLDPYKKIAERYGVKSLPALFVIDPRGIIRSASLGFDEKKQSMTEKLEEIVSNIRANKAVAGMQSVSEAVAIKVDAVPKFTAQQKFHAVARVECGESLEKISQELKIDQEQIKQWYEDIKKATQSAFESSK